MAKNTRHVVPSTSGGWSVRKQGAARASKTFVTKVEAERYGKDLAQRDQSDVFIHGANGMIQSHKSFSK